MKKIVVALTMGRTQEYYGYSDTESAEAMADELYDFYEDEVAYIDIVDDFITPIMPIDD